MSVRRNNIKQMLQDDHDGECSVADESFSTLIQLPLALNLSSGDIMRIAALVNAVSG